MRQVMVVISLILVIGCDGSKEVRSTDAAADLHRPADQPLAHDSPGLDHRAQEDLRDSRGEMILSDLPRADVAGDSIHNDMTMLDLNSSDIQTLDISVPDSASATDTTSPSDIASAPDAVLPDASTPDAALPDTAIPDAGTSSLPLLYYTFENQLENQGSLGAAYDGTAAGTTYVPGLINQGLKFGGASTSSLVVYNSAAAIGAYPSTTISVWFKEDPGAAGANLLFYQAAGFGCTTYHYTGFQGTLRTACEGSSSYTGIASTGYIVGRWQNLIFRHAGTAAAPGGGADMEIYLNNELVGVVSNPGGAQIWSTTMEDLILGAYSNFTIDELKVYGQVFNEQQQCTEVIGGTWDGGTSTCLLPTGPEPDPLLLYYTFDGHATNQGSLGSVYDGVSSNVSYVDGMNGQAVKFMEVADSLVRIPYTAGPLSIDSTYTIGFWFKEDAVLLKATVLDFRGGLGGCETYHGASGTALFTCCSSSGTGDCGSFPYTAGGWHHLIYRYAGTSPLAGGGADLQLYLDNEPVQTISITNGDTIFNALQLPDFWLGLGRTSSDPGNFQIDELKIFNQVFSVQEQCTEVIGGSWDAQSSSCSLPTANPDVYPYCSASCQVTDDCCECNAAPSGEPGPPCPITSCGQNTTCKENKITPLPYCYGYGGQNICLITDDRTCSTDGDCQLVDTCCNCMALSNHATAPDCDPTSCGSDTECTMLKAWVSAQDINARCIDGRCRVVLQ